MARAKKSNKSVQESLANIEKSLGLGDGGMDTDELPPYLPGMEQVPPSFDPDSSADLVASKVLDTLPPVWEGCYAKVYKIRPLPPGAKPPQYMGNVPDLREVPDLEVHLQQLARVEGWGSGTYKIGVFQDNGRTQTPIEWRDLELHVPVEMIKSAGSGNGNGNTTPGSNGDFLSQVQQYSALSKAFQDAVPKVADPVSLADQQMRMFQSGIELAKGQLTPQQQQNPLELVTAMVNLGLLQVPGHGTTQVQAPPQPDTLTLLRTLKELLPSPVPAPAPVPIDPWEGLRKLTELGILDPKKKEEDTLGAMDKVVNLFTTLAPILGGGGEKTTATTELIRTIGPQTGEIVGKITEAVNNVVSFGKEKLRMRLGVSPVPQVSSAPVPRIPATSPVVSPPPPSSGFGSIPGQNPGPATTTTSTTNSPLGNYPVTTGEAPAGTPAPTLSSYNPNRNPVINQILDAVHQGDTGFYPKLQELMTAYINPQIMEQLLSGAVSPETLLTSLSNMTQVPELAGDGVKAYLHGFLEWHRSNTIVVNCTGTCEGEYEVPKEEWVADTERVCEECGGNLVEVQG